MPTGEGATCSTPPTGGCWTEEERALADALATVAELVPGDRASGAARQVAALLRRGD